MPANRKKSGINLIIKPEEQLSISSQFLNWALTYGRYIIIIIQIVVLSVFFMRFKIDRDRTDLKEGVVQKKALVESIIDVENEIKRVQKRLSDIKLITSNQDIYLRVIKFLEKNTPVDTSFALLSFSKNTVKFVAISENLKTFNFLLKRIQDDKLLTDIQLEDLKRRSDGRVEFRLQATINLSSYESSL
ncbi:hypothetical protein A2W14_00950 [Candidatus Gottesmanbacteria bacterium RBG_16_37_8]|uniref:Fimbrial assembly protein n=1 Tax=Candidatus Gottesmanbacteria bacterium RBG_16_37_8 TaxID=1798371 RepID=A0A1F5YQ01_9BACT|nr:MAG: hypothetical protein A2W14_00950 [Candidatus Gottesmanbacteria bacterium RBG_16_37_8]